LTYAFAAQLLSAAGARLREVRIDRLVDETYYAQAVLKSNGATRVVDARPSDAIALGLESGAPIRVNPEVIQQAGLTRVELADKRRVIVDAQRPGACQRNPRAHHSAPRKLGGLHTLLSSTALR
jgi:bifunctional DNase/RNase